MKKIERISKIIHDCISKDFYTSLLDWYRVTELKENDLYEIRLYKNFFPDDESDLEEFKHDIEKIVETLERNVLIKLDDEFYFTTITDVNVDNSTLEIVVTSEKVSKRVNN